MAAYLSKPSPINTAIASSDGGAAGTAGAAAAGLRYEPVLTGAPKALFPSNASPRRWGAAAPAC
eukprot:5192-Heterococcus_DN1.PRE.3